MSWLENFNHQLYGPEDGPKWVFLHGLMGFLSNWRKIIAGLESTERCLSFDQRGHGRSFHPPEGEYGPEFYAEDLRKILDELGWDKITLVGHSMGGRNGLHFVSKYPERVTRFVIEDISPGQGETGETYFEWMLGLIPTPFVDRAAMRTFFTEEFQPKLGTGDSAAQVGPFLMANLVDQPGGGLDWRFNKAGIIESARKAQSEDRWHEVEDLKVPTLVVKGEKSKYLPLPAYQRMLSANSLIQGVIIQGSGHWVHADNPEAFLAAIRDFAGLSPL